MTEKLIQLAYYFDVFFALVGAAVLVFIALFVIYLAGKGYRG